MAKGVVQCGMSLDPDQARKILKIYRGAKIAGRSFNDVKKAKNMLNSHSVQVDFLMDSEEIISRVRNKEVRSGDVGRLARSAVNSVPKLYNFLSNHIKKSKGGKNA